MQETFTLLIASSKSLDGRLLISSSVRVKAYPPFVLQKMTFSGFNETAGFSGTSGLEFKRRQWISFCLLMLLRFWVLRAT